MIVSVEYPSVIKVYFHPDAEETGVWYLAGDLPVLITHKQDEEEKELGIILPGDFKHDFASIPDIVPKWICDKQDARLASMIHDFLYTWRVESREFADAVFLKVMEQNHVAAWRRTAMYNAVRAFGQKAWDD